MPRIFGSNSKGIEIEGKFVGQQGVLGGNPVKTSAETFVDVFNPKNSKARGK